MPYIEMRHISKRFGQVLANDDVSIDVDRGEILSLLGENGSGKSTLVNMLAGIYTPDAGAVFIEGREQSFRSPNDAIAAGIGMVHQHFMLIPVMTALENIALGEKQRGVFLSKQKISEKIDKIQAQFGLSIDYHKKIYDMSVGEKQTVEIIKMLYRGAKTLILDEPTAVLTPQETAKLFEMMRFMKEAGSAIIIITHKLAEVMEISDRVTVLRKGRAIGTVATGDSSPLALTEMMVGASISLEIERSPGPGPAPAAPEPVLNVEGLSLRNREGVPVLDGMGFQVAGGEILGVAGIAGSGQKELCEVIAGLQRADSGSVLFLGDELLGLSPLAIKKKGVRLSFIPEDRLGMGLVGGMSVTDNVLLRGYEKTPGALIDRNAGKTRAEGIVKKYDISTPSVNHRVRKLSGGNIQKVLLGRELETAPRLLITAYPVRGLDIGASYAIYHLLNEQKSRGVAVLFIGEDLDVLMALCDRLMVIHGGKVMATLDPRSCSKEEIGLLMLGHEMERAA
jgi:simple sugar transport system ATP-binding protein